VQEFQALVVGRLGHSRRLSTAIDVDTLLLVPGPSPTCAGALQGGPELTPECCQRDRGKAPRAAPGRDSGTVNLVPDGEADCLPDADAPNRDCAGAMARVKAALAVLGALRP